MGKTQVNAEVFGKIHLLCEELGIDAQMNAPHKTGEYLRDAVRIGRLLTEEAETLTDCADDALGELYDKNVSEGVDRLEQVVNQLSDVQESLEALRESIVGTLAALREFAEPNGWAPLRSDEEMESILEDGFSKTNEMSLGYQNGLYALLFEQDQNDESLVMEPIVVAVGRDEDVDEIRAYLEQFMDMEDEA